MLRQSLIVLFAVAVVPVAGLAQHANMDHSAHAAMHADSTRPMPKQPGQAAFATLSEIVRLLEADSTTDWSRVNVERLRQHLIDMDEVVMRSSVAQRPTAGGIEADVTGTGRTAGAIRRMLTAHAAELDAMPDLVARTAPLANGIRLTVTSANPGDGKAVARIRALGPIGLLTLGDHHAMHHMMMMGR